MVYRTKYEYDGKAKVIFNEVTGMKIRFAEEGFDYVKAQYPELADIKITDFCSFYKKCQTCYMDSSDTGEHGDLDFILSTIYQLSNMGVFEIALGGGSPNQHPNFIEIIREAYMLDVIPNFTTFDDEWLQNEKMVDAVKKYVGGIGVSVYSKNSLAKYHNIKKAMDGKCMVMVQHVAGMFPYKTTFELVKEVDHILLLGYKSVGRGSRQHPNTLTDEQVKELFSFKNKKISVDTAFLDNYSHVLDEIGIPMELRSSPEGKFSCYIDAVEKTIGPSSYCNKSEMLPIGKTFNEIKEQFATF
jgi:MoaA/NifB/PqqE/SkfB family radical SAM enzyme